MEAGSRYGIYDQFAWYYSRGWGEEFHERARPVLAQHIFPHIAEGARILDLCCGSGDLSALLAGCGYRVTGIDGSAEMLRYARDRVPGAEFVHADARCFSFPAAFDAALSTFDSLNHLLVLEELRQVFGNVFTALVSGGRFVFDLNMAEAFDTLWHGHYASVEEDVVGVTRGSFDREKKLGRADVTLFQRAEEGLWRRSDVSVEERCYERVEITEALQAAGFTEVEAREAWELGMRGDVAMGREWFFARKP